MKEGIPSLECLPCVGISIGFCQSRNRLLPVSKWLLPISKLLSLVLGHGFELLLGRFEVGDGLRPIDLGCAVEEAVARGGCEAVEPSVDGGDDDVL